MPAVRKRAGRLPGYKLDQEIHIAVDALAAYGCRAEKAKSVYAVVLATRFDALVLFRIDLHR